MFLDQVSITVQGGRGGNGAVLFRAVKFVPRGGPEGGDGGKGGDVIFLADPNADTLSDFAREKFFQAEDGEKGWRNRCRGKSGEDLFLKVPVGTSIKDAQNGQALADLVTRGQTFTAARGGKGGFGNAHFVSSTRQCPDFAESGDEGEEHALTLELKLIADAGLVGYPNAGKSTLLSVVTKARPKIADYPFTTLIPNLGVARVGENELVLADIPGLIEGAHQGKGLGHEFLKHIERTRVLLHLIDGLSEDIGKIYKNIRKELRKYSRALVSRPEIVVITKADAIEPSRVEKLKKELKRAGAKKVLVISAVAQQGLAELLYETEKIVAAEKKQLTISNEQLAIDNEQLTIGKSKRVNGDTGKQPNLTPHLGGGRSASRLGEGKFKIFRPGDREAGERTSIRDWQLKKIRGAWIIKNSRLEQIVRMSDLEHPSARARVYDILDKVGVLKELKKKNAKRFKIGEKCLDC
jgi:GTP-binding protein